jgi:Maltokinase N-terminal cap domain
MAVLHRATIAPTKREIAVSWLDRQLLGGAGDLEMMAAYRLDDPAGEVGIEGLLVRRSGSVFHLPVTYRGAPLDGAEDFLVSTMEHSVLGHRWVYDAAGDPVALACYAAALAGQQEQAVFELWDGGTRVDVRPHTVTLTASGAGPAGGEVRLLREPGDPAGQVADGQRLVASWAGGAGVIAVLA